jgi:hypothetical protein
LCVGFLIGLFLNNETYQKTIQELRNIIVQERMFSNECLVRIQLLEKKAIAK